MFAGSLWDDRGNVCLAQRGDSKLKIVKKKNKKKNKQKQKFNAIIWIYVLFSTNRYWSIGEE